MLSTNTTLIGALSILAALTLPGVIGSYRKEKLSKNSSIKLPTKGKFELNLPEGQRISFTEATFVTVTAEKEFKLIVKTKNGLSKVASQKYNGLFMVTVECTEFKVLYNKNPHFSICSFLST